MSPIHWWSWKKSNVKETSKNQSKRKVLVIAWWWFRWAYALWVLKALEKLWINKEIDAIYWVSIWSIVGALRASWMKANKILELLTDISVKDFCGNDILRKSWWLVSSHRIAWLFDKYMPEDFESLKIPFFAWATDTNTAKFILFNHGNLRKAVLGSMSIPGFFPPVQYDKYCLIDWFVLNNFPVDLAKKSYPNHEIIWIELNPFIPNQKINTTIDNLTLAFDILMHSNLIKKKKYIDYLLCGDPSMWVLSLKDDDMVKSFNLWYNEYFLY